MKILFVENRGKTDLWEAAALQLSLLGHTVAFVVQNHLYTPKKNPNNIAIYKIPYPKSKSKVNYASPLSENLSTDRNVKYFRGNTKHYKYYETKINQIIEDFQPHIVFGEVTLFHEIMVMERCIIEGIPYIHPTSSRYPSDRLFLFLNNTQVPYVKSNENWSYSVLSKYLGEILGSKIKPNYMARVNYASRVRLLISKIKVTLGWILGERYNTPSPLMKLLLALNLRVNLKKWKKFSRQRAYESGGLLYALQMQPESNLDIWGSKFNDQTTICDEISANLPKGMKLFLKLNPKVKYELNDELLTLIASRANIIPLAPDVTMECALNKSIGCLTVTGTIGLECVLGMGNAVTLCHPVIQKNFPQYHASTITEGVDKVFSNKNDKKTPDHGIDLLKIFVADSFPGIISESNLNKKVLSESNVQLIISAMLVAINKREVEMTC